MTANEMNASESREEPLVSIIVLSYNSATTIEATLGSLVLQDYPNLEVMLCDDGSMDLTPSILRSWADAHRHLFRRIVVLVAATNEGICRNIAKGYAAAHGVWLKPIAGDDLLMPGAVRRYVNEALASDASVVFSDLATFRTGDVLRPESITARPKDWHSPWEGLADAPDLPLHRLVIENVLPAPAAFIRRQAYEAVGGIDLSFKHLDDWPLWIRMAQRGKSFHVFKQKLVWYRTDSSLTTERRLATDVNRDYLLDLVHFYEKYQKNHLPLLVRIERSVAVLRWKLAAGKLRKHPMAYKAMRLLHAVSPLAWRNLYGALTDKKFLRGRSGS